MKIYIIPAWYPQNKNDVTANFFREQAHALARRGHDITVIHIEPISFTRLLRQSKHYISVWQDGNVRTVFHKVIVPIPAKLRRIQDRYISKLFYKIIKRQISEDKKNGLGAPDILHAHVSHSCAYYCLFAKEKLNIPLVVTEHYSGLLLGTVTDSEYSKVKQTIENSNAFIFVGSNFQKTVCDKLQIQRKTYVIPNMVDVSPYKIKPKPNKIFTFLSACHLKTNKSVDLVITAFHHAFDKDIPVKLLVAGDGEEYNNLKSLVKQYGEENRIELLGKYSREDSYKLFSNADAFVLTSKVETFGIVYIEALACGVPCVGTKGQGADDIIDESNGYLVEYGNVPDLSNKMLELYNHKEKYDAEKIRKSCIERFSNETVTLQLEELYEKILRGRTK